MRLKKIVGLVLIVVSILLMLILTISIAVLFAEPTDELFYYALLGFALFYGMSFLLLLYGRKLFKGRKLSIPVDEKLELDVCPIKLKVKMGESEFVKLNFIEAYTSRYFIFISIIGIAMVCHVLNFFFANPMEEKSVSFFQIGSGSFFAIILLLGLPISLYFNARKTIRSNKWVSETIQYEFDLDNIKVKGETFDLNMKWAAARLVRERQDWFIIYTEKKRGFFIPKRIFQTKEEEVNFKKLLYALQGIEVRLG